MAALWALSGLAALCTPAEVAAQVLVTPSSIDQTQGDSHDRYRNVPGNLIDGSGLSETPTADSYGTVTHAWANSNVWTTGTAHNPSYFGASGAVQPQFVLTLEDEHALSALVVWGPGGNATANEASQFTVEFSTDGATYENAQTLATGGQLVAASNRMAFTGGPFRATHVRLTITGNARSAGYSSGPGGDRVTLGEIRFLDEPVEIAAAPAAPTGLRAAPVDQGTQLSWTAPDDGGGAITGYRYRYKTGDGEFGEWTDIADSAPGGANETSYTVTGLTNGTAYTFEVRAVNGAGAGPESNQAAVTPSDAAAPVAATALLTPSSIDQTQGDSFDRYRQVPGNLIDGSGLSTTPTADNYGSVTHTWRSRSVWTTGTAHNPSYFGASGAVQPQFELTLAEQRALSALVVWGPGGNATANEASQFTVEFSTDGATYGNAQTLATGRQLVGAGNRMAFTGGPFQATHVRLTVTGNARSAGYSNGPGGDRVTFGEIRFLGDTLSATGPHAPADLEGVPVNQGAELSWTAPFDGGGAITGYRYRYKVGDGEFGEWTDIADSAPGEANETGYTVTGLANGTAHTFEVRAVNSVGAGSVSNQAAVTPMVTVPDAPTALQATGGDRQVSLSWTAPSSDGGGAITGHQYRYQESREDFGTWTDITDSAPGGANETGYTVTGLTNGTAYTFEVRALNSGGGSPESNQAEATPVAVPAAPTGLQAVPVSSGTRLSWTVPSDDGGSGITGYRYRYKEGDGEFGEWADIADSAPGGANATGYTVTGLTNGTAYTFEVRAVNAVGAGTESNQAGVTPVATAPGAPTGLQATGGNLQVTLNWTAPADTGGQAITGYRYRYMEADDANFGAWTDISDSASGGANETSYTVTGLDNGVVHVFEVRAVNGVGAGAASNQARARTGADACEASLPAIGAVDWVVTPVTATSVICARNDDVVVMSNGIVERRIDVSTNGTTTSLKHLVTDTEMLHEGNRPEAIVSLEGTTYNVGGTTATSGFVYASHTVENSTTKPYEWTPYESDGTTVKPWSQVAPWPARGKSVVFVYEPHSSMAAAHRNLTVKVRYEIYDGIAVILKKIIVENSSATAVELRDLTIEQLRIRNAVRDRLLIDTDYQGNGGQWRRNDIGRTYTRTDTTDYREYTVLYKQGPAFHVGNRSARSGQRWETTFESFRTFLLVHGTDHYLGKSMELKKMYRTVAPQLRDDPIFAHVLSDSISFVRARGRDAAAAGFEMLIQTFGSGFNMHNTSNSYRQARRRLYDELRGLGIRMGGYVLLYTGRIYNPSVSSCSNHSNMGLASTGHDVFQQRTRDMITATAMDLIEIDGNYGLQRCDASNHAYMVGGDDSKHKQYVINNEKYAWLRARDVYINVPDWHFLAGINKSSIGYQERAWSRPRQEQLVFGRQYIYSGSYEKSPPMTWTFLPIDSYHGGGDAATFYPQSRKLFDYNWAVAQNFLAGVQATFRGRQLFDTNDVRDVVKYWVDVYKAYRPTIKSDIVHIKPARRDSDNWTRATDIDAFMHAAPQQQERGLLVVFNQTDSAKRQTLTVPLYDTGLTDLTVRPMDPPGSYLSVRDIPVHGPWPVRENGNLVPTIVERDWPTPTDTTSSASFYLEGVGDPVTLVIDSNGNAKLPVDLPPMSFTWYVVTEPGTIPAAPPAKPSSLPRFDVSRVDPVNTKFAGTAFGSGSDAANAFDGDTGTVAEGSAATDRVGIDLGAGAFRVARSVRLYPGAAAADRQALNGAQIQGSSDGTDYQTLAKLNFTPQEQWIELALSNTTPYRYYRLQGGGDVAELEFYEREAAADAVAVGQISGDAFGDPTADIANVFDGRVETFYEGTDTTSYVGLDLGTGAARSLGRFRYFPASDFPARVENARIQGSNTSATSGFVDLHTLPARATADWYEATLDSDTAYRWYRYLGGTTRASIAELEFHEHALPLVKASGTVSGSAAAQDGLPSTSDPAAVAGGHATIDTGTDPARVLKGVRFYPRASHPERLVSGQIQGSQDGTNYTTLYTVAAEPKVGWNRVTLSNATAYRYYRYKAADATNADIGEIEFWVESRNLARSKTVVASSANAAQGASLAVDGDLATHWQSDPTSTGDQTLKIDLGAVGTVDGVRLVWEDEYAVTYQVHTSTDDTTWVRRDFVYLDGAGETETRLYSPAVQARYVRITFQSGNGSGGYALREAQVLGTGNVAEASIPTVTVTITAPPAEVPEGGTVTFTVASDEQPRRALTVNLEISETGSKLSSTAPTSVRIPASQSSATVTLSTLDDQVAGERSVVTATLVAGAGYELGTPASAVVTVAENDVAALDLAFDVERLGEGRTATLTLSVTNGVTFAEDRIMTLVFAGTASQSDYSAPSELTLPAGRSSVSAVVSAVTDSEVENEETLTVSGSLGDVESGSATLAILDPSALSDDASLSALSLTGVDIGTFAADDLDYVAVVEDTTTATTVTATPADGAAAVAIADATGETAGAQRTVSLSEGPNRIRVTVTAEDGTTTRTYGITVTRAAGSAISLDAENSAPQGIWSDGEHLWVVDSTDWKLYAYQLSDGARAAGRDIAVAPQSDNGSPMDLWSNGETAWVAAKYKLLAFNVSDGAAATSRNVSLPRRSLAEGGLWGVWSDGETVWVSRQELDELPAYRLSDGARRSGRDIDVSNENTNPAGLWSDGETVWVADQQLTLIKAYRLWDGSRETARDVETGWRDGNPAGLWSDGATLWVTTPRGSEVRRLLLPARAADGNAALRELALTDVDIGDYLSAKAGYSASVANAVSTTTVTATPVADGATVLIRDAQGATTGLRRSVSLSEGDNAITVTVISPDGTRTRVYTIDVRRGTATPLTARFADMPALHDGSTPFRFKLHFSEEVRMNHTTLRDSAFAVTGATITGARRLTQGSNAGWEIVVQPSGSDDVVIELPANRACDVTGAVCTRDGKQLSQGLRVTVEDQATYTPIQATIAGMTAPVSEGGTATFTVTLSRAAVNPLSVALTFTETGSMLAPQRPSTVSFDEGDASATVGLATLDDRMAESDSVVTATLGTGNGYELGTPSSATATVADNDLPVYEVLFEPVELEEGGTATLTVRITNGITFMADQVLTLAFSGTASASDHSVPATLTLPANASSVQAIVSAVDDEDLEGAETLTVTASLGSAEIGSATLTIAASDPLSDDASLSALALTGVDIGTFAADDFDYAAVVDNATSATTVTATPADAAATVVIADANGETAGTQRSVSLSEGPNRIRVTVTAEDGTTTRTYGITVTRAAGSAISLDAENSAPQGIWSDGEHLWVVDGTDWKLYAYQLSDGARAAGRDIAVAPQSDNAVPMDLWSNGETAWVAAAYKLLAFNLSDGAAATSLNVSLPSKNLAQGRLWGVWSDGETVWATRQELDELRAYRLSDGARRSGRDVDVSNENTGPVGLWSDGETVWVADQQGTLINAYRLWDGSRETARDVETGWTDGNPVGLWSDGTTLWVATSQGSEVRRLLLPARAADGNAALRELALTDVDIGRYFSAKANYSALVANAVSTTTVTATPVADAATVVIEDARGATTGLERSVSLAEGDNEITVTVTSPDATRTRAYTLDVQRGTATPLTARFADMPALHDGSRPFRFKLHFSEDVRMNYTTLRDSAFEVTGATITGARRLTQGSNAGWEVVVQPSGDGEVGIVLPAGRACDQAGAVCTRDGKQLSNRLEATVPGPSSQNP